MSSLAHKTPPWLVGLAWLIVALPLGWGLYQSVTKSKPLFTVNKVTTPEQRSPAPAK